MSCHHWTDEENLIAFYLAKAYSGGAWKSDAIAKDLLAVGGVTVSSLAMAVSNFRYLMGGDGLSNSSAAQRAEYERRKDTTLEEL